MQLERSEHMNHQAREWFVTLQSGALSAEQRAAFARWYAVAEHAQAFQEYQMIWQDLDAIACGDEARHLRASVAEPRWLAALRGWWSQPAGAWGFVGAATAAFMVGLFFAFAPAPEPTVVDYQTVTAQQQQVQLIDGSVITLGAKSHIRVWHTAQTRQVELLSGLAFFEVAKDPSRPFYVQAGDVSVRVVGTKFDVSRQVKQVRVTVLEGRVAVKKSVDQTGQEYALTAGQSLTKIAGQTFSDIAEQSAQAAGDWRFGRLVYRDALLVDVIADANRYFDGEILLGSPSLQQARVTLALRTDQIENFPAMLQQTLPVMVHREAQNRLVILPTSSTQ